MGIFSQEFCPGHVPGLFYWINEAFRGYIIDMRQFVFVECINADLGGWDYR
ncbi:hypothetical protein QTN24_12740 [Cupriavidus sp. SZY C1]|uniref:hypothetical protein n=1 Tax=Cupriavidus sp. SZY C1 TaxID=3055037 RepID=UPI0028B6FD69|nr:hypothetical protein [Cupriavidus sp. SZY C1]MDT6962367.1 hypothetical protein [Cupriavidus sp. SZY C1]